MITNLESPKEHVYKSIRELIVYLAGDEKNPLGTPLVRSQVFFCKTCCDMPKVANIIDQIRFFQPLPDTVNHKN